MIGFTEHINNGIGDIRKGEARKADLLHVHELFPDNIRNEVFAFSKKHYNRDTLRQCTHFYQVRFKLTYGNMYYAFLLMLMPECRCHTYANDNDYTVIIYIPCPTGENIDKLNEAEIQKANDNMTYRMLASMKPALNYDIIVVTDTFFCIESKDFVISDIKKEVSDFRSVPEIQSLFACKALPYYNDAENSLGLTFNDFQSFLSPCIHIPYKDITPAIFNDLCVLNCYKNTTVEILPNEKAILFAANMDVMKTVFPEYQVKYGFHGWYINNNFDDVSSDVMTMMKILNIIKDQITLEIPDYSK